MAKPREDIGGALGVRHCAGPDGLDVALAAFSLWGRSLIQEHIPGGADTVRTAVLLLDRRSRLVAHLTTRKLRT